MRQGDLDEFGYTQGCHKWDHIRVYGETPVAVGHSDNWRKRIVDKLSETLAGRTRISAAAERGDRFVAEAIHRQDPDD